VQDAQCYVQGKNITLINVFVPPEAQAIEHAIRSLLPDIDLLVVRGTIGGVSAKKLAPPVPVVFLSVGAPVDIGLVESLAHPGGNMTGTTFESGWRLSEAIERRACIASRRPSPIY
jgi:putative tryptophan/tyrosine transport system substrate-binding protein